MRLALVVLALSAPSLALAGDEATQLWLDHAVAASDDVVRGRYEAGKLEATEELKGKLARKLVGVERDQIEPADDELAPGAPRMKGTGVFFLLGRFDGKGADPLRFMSHEGVEGVAWLGTVSYLSYRPNADDKEALVEIAERARWDAMLGRALERDRALAEAVAIVETSARVAKLLEVAKSAHDAPPEAVSALGADPFAQRALIEIGHAGALDVLEKLRKETEHAWLKPLAVRAMAPAPSSEKSLEKIALDKASSEDEVVAAIDMLFSSEKADVAALEKLSFDERARVRRAVASALREKVKDLETLERLMKDPDASVRGAATEAARAAARRLGLDMPEGK